MELTTAALKIRHHVENLPERLIWSRDAYALLCTWGLNRTQSADALRHSGLYPVKARVAHGMTRWQLDKPHPWTPDRTPGTRPATVRRKCRQCGMRYVPPANMTHAAEWD